MKRIYLLLFIAINLSLFAEEDWSLWKYMKDLKIDSNNPTYVVFELDDDVYSNTNQTLSDLRIVDSNNNQIPYYINSEEKSSKDIEKIYETALLSENYYDITRLTLFEYQVLETSEDIQINSFKIALNRESYSQQLEIYGRFDDSDWQLIKQDTIYRLNDIVKEEIFPRSQLKFNFYKVVLINNDNQYSISDFTPHYSERLLNSYSYSKESQIEFDIEQLDNSTKLTIHNPNRLKLQSLTLEIDGNFNRKYSLRDIDGRNISDDFLYNFENEEVIISNFEILFNWNRSPELVLTIQNDDNFPLVVNSITASYFVNKVVFEDIGVPPYRVIYGNKNSTKPTYDIESFKQYINNSDMVVAHLQSEAENPDFKIDDSNDNNSSFNYRPLFNISIIIVSALLIFLISVKLFKKEG